MTLHILHTLSGLLIIICFVGKVALHYSLDYKHGRSIGFVYSLATPIQYFRPYKSATNKEFIKLQRVCNLLLRLTFAAILINLILGAAIYFNNK